MIAAADTARGTTYMAAAHKPSKGSRRPLSAAEKDALHEVIEALDMFFQYNKTMPLRAVTSFLFAALHEDEGFGPVELARKYGIANTVMSRYMLDLGERNRHMGPGAGLVTTGSVDNDLRAKPVQLTDKGVDLLHKFLDKYLRGQRIGKRS